MTEAIKTLELSVPVQAEKLDLKTGTFHPQADLYAALRGELEEKEAGLEPLRKRVAELETELLSFTDELVAATSSASLYGADALLEISAKGRKVVETDKVRIRELLGDATAFEIANFGVTDLKRYLTGEQIEDVLLYDNVNKRKVKVKKL